MNQNNSSKLKEYKKNYRSKNIDKIRKVKQIWRHKNKEWVRLYQYNYRMKNLEKSRLYSIKSYWKNRDKRIVAGKLWALKNKKRVAIKTRNWQRQNPDKVRMNNWKRLTRLKNIVHSFSYDDWIEKLNKHKFCAFCKNKNNLCLDHIIPISKVEKGHIYSIDDVQILCKSCNSQKSAKIIWQMQKQSSIL